MDLPMVMTILWQFDCMCISNKSYQFKLNTVMRSLNPLTKIFPDYNVYIHTDYSICDCPAYDFAKLTMLNKGQQ